VPHEYAGVEDRVNPTNPDLPATHPVLRGLASQNLRQKALNPQAKRPNCQAGPRRSGAMTARGEVKKDGEGAGSASADSKILCRRPLGGGDPGAIG
jgi:hypothetical protein